MTTVRELDPPALRLEDVSVRFTRGALGRRTVTQAVNGVSLDIAAGETLGIVGESGCGKSTLARTLMLLNRPASGRVLSEGQDIHRARGAERRALRRRMQMVFQDPSGSLNPRMTIEDLIIEPMIVHRVARAERRGRLEGLLADVGLPRSVARRFPHELSGGQLQRVSIARALAVDPSVLIADEPVSALDVSVQVQIVNLLLDLQKDRGMTLVFISHDLAVVAKMSDRVAVMYLGEIVEVAPADDIFARPRHPYTRSLMSAIAVPDPRLERQRERIVLTGDLPSPTNPPTGCRFHTRCWLRQSLDNPEACVTERPALVAEIPGHAAACHFTRLAADGVGVGGGVAPAHPDA